MKLSERQVVSMDYKGNTKRQHAYLEVFNGLKTAIEKGEYAAGELLPPEPQLEQIFYVSRTTVRKAVELLVADGIVRVKQGYGTEVLSRKTAQNLSMLTSVSQTLANRGYAIGTKSMCVRVITGEAVMCEMLKLPKGSKLVEICRTQTADGEPVAIAKNYIPYELVKGIEAVREKIISLYDFLNTSYGIVINGSKDKISACNASFEESEILCVEPGEALITIYRTCYHDDKIVEIDDVKIIASKYEFEVYLRGNSIK